MSPVLLFAPFHSPFLLLIFARLPLLSETFHLNLSFLTPPLLSLFYLPSHSLSISHALLFSAQLKSTDFIGLKVKEQYCTSCTFSHRLHLTIFQVKDWTVGAWDVLSMVEDEGESQSSWTVQLNQRVAAWMDRSPGGQQIKEGGRSTGRKRLYGLWRSYWSTENRETERVPLCDRPTLVSPLTAPLSLYMSHTHHSQT